MKQEIKPVNANEQHWIAGNLKAAENLVAMFSPMDAGKPISPAALDTLYGKLLDAGKTDPEEVNSIINMIGVAFGDCIIRESNFEWAVVTDEQGSELAIVADPQGIKTMVFPANFIAKRWERKETNFIEESFHKILSQANTIQEEVGKAEENKKSWWKSMFG
jgi:hypothetical protein